MAFFVTAPHLVLLTLHPNSAIRFSWCLFSVYVYCMSFSAPGSEEAVDKGYTYIIVPSPDMTTCLLDKTNIATMKLSVEAKGYMEWRVSDYAFINTRKDGQGWLTVMMVPPGVLDP